MCFCKIWEDWKLSWMTKKESKTFLDNTSGLVEIFKRNTNEILIWKEWPIEILRKTNIWNKNTSKEEKKRIWWIDKWDNL